MTSIEVIAVGKLKEKYLRDAVNEYSKRLSGYCRLTIAEADDEKTVEKASPAERERILLAEGQRINRLCKRKENTHTIALCVDGRQYSSEEFAGLFEKLSNSGVSTIRFLIGGSMGLHESVTALSDERMSFSKLTFPHQLMRVILLEQIYRAFKITGGEPYHK